MVGKPICDIGICIFPPPLLALGPRTSLLSNAPAPPGNILAKTSIFMALCNGFRGYVHVLLRLLEILGAVGLVCNTVSSKVKRNSFVVLSMSTRSCPNSRRAVP